MLFEIGNHVIYIKTIMKRFTCCRSNMNLPESENDYHANKNEQILYQGHK